MNEHLVLNIFHVFFVAPLLIYVGVQRASSPEWLYKVLLAIGVVIVLYHTYRAYVKFRSGSSSLWVNLIHVAYVGPLLMWIGIQGADTPRAAFEMLLLLAFAAGGYNLYGLILQLNTVSGGKEDH